MWAGENIEPEKTPSEIMPTEPYLLGSHSGCAGIWVSGPTDIPGTPKEWSWGYRSMTTVKGLFTAGDGVGASGHKFSSGSFTEGRIAAKAMVKYCLDNKGLKPELGRDVKEMSDEIYRPVKNFLENKNYTTDIDVNPHFISPKMLQFRLQKIMDEYVAGVATYYRTNAKMLEVAEKKLEMLKEDSLKMRAKDLHELLRAWENFHRIMAAEAHMKHIQFREETRYPGFYYRMDKNYIDDDSWKCFVNSTYDRTTHKWALKKVPYKQLIKD
jgi:adenylylsulfate reductase subunit A